MAKFQDLLNYYRPFWASAIFSIAAASIFEIIALVVPYTIGQILNVLSFATRRWVSAKCDKGGSEINRVTARISFCT